MPLANEKSHEGLPHPWWPLVAPGGSASSTRPVPLGPTPAVISCQAVVLLPGLMSTATPFTPPRVAVSSLPGEKKTPPLLARHESHVGGTGPVDCS